MESSPQFEQAKERKSKRTDTASVSTDHDEMDEEARLRKQLRRAKKMAKHFAKLGLDENGEELDNFSLTQYPVRELKFTLPGMQDEVAINPVVTLLAVAFLFGLVTWCSVDSETALGKIVEWKSFLSLTFTWLIQGAKAIYFFFALLIWYKYGHIQLGNKDEKPEYSTLAYATMIFLANTGSSLLTYAVLEPLSHQKNHFFAELGYRSQDEIDLFAITMTLNDWSSGFAPSAVVAIALCLAVYRYKLPLSYRSCLYPLLGQYTWGWIGDVVDGFAIVVTLMGISSSLGLASMNIVTGFVNMGWIDGDKTADQLAGVFNIIIWILTVMSLASVVSGLGGVKFVCLLGMALACLLTSAVMIFDDTKFLLNLQVQTVGYYLQTSIFQLNFWTDAFGQLREGAGRATDGKAAEASWMESWLNYTMAWWFVSAVMAGHFICRISRGRKVWEVIMYSMVVPAALCLFWFSAWGGIALRQSRQALELETLGERWYNNSAHFLSDGSSLCYDVPQDDLLINDETVFTNHLPGVSPVCGFDEDNANTAIFHVLHSFSAGNGSGLGQTLSCLFMFTTAIFFLSGAGLAALFADTVASSGRKNNHIARRMFWIVTIGSLATALLNTGGGDALSAVQAALILCGLPCAILILYTMQSVVLLCDAVERGGRKVTDYAFPEQPEFSVPIYGGIFNAMEYVFSMGKVNAIRVELGMHQPTKFQVTECVKGIFVPFVSLRQVLDAEHPNHPKTNLSVTALFGACYLAWCATLWASLSHPGATGYMYLLCLVKGVGLAWIRSEFRARYHIRSNLVGDIVSSLLFWPQVLVQMRSWHMEAARTTEKATRAIPNEDEEA